MSEVSHRNGVDLKHTRRQRSASSEVHRIAPHAQEAEQCVIGCCITERASIGDSQMTITSGEFFYDLRCQTVWGVIVEMPVNEVDLITVHQKLKDKKLLESVGGISFLSGCQNLVSSTANLPYWLELLREKYLLRKLIATGTNVVARVYEFTGSVDELMDEVESDVLKIRQTKTLSTGIQDLVAEATQKIEHRSRFHNAVSGMPTGLCDLDRLTDGLHKGEMIVLAGLPSTGKTALAVNIAVHNAIRQTPCAIFSAEMRPVQLVVRSICSESRVNFFKVTEMDFPKMIHAASQMSNAPLFIEQANRLSISQLAAIARRLKQKNDVQLIVVDYIQLLSGIGDNREQEISNISKGIKAMALELDVPVIALSQLTDDGKLRESRAIGQDADSIWKLANIGEWMPSVQPIKLNVEKCRDGATGKVELTFFKEWTRFEDTAKVSDEDLPL